MAGKKQNKDVKVKKQVDSDSASGSNTIASKKRTCEDSPGSGSDSTSSPAAKSKAYGKGEAWTAEERTLILEYYFDKHPMTPTSWRAVATLLGREERHCQQQFKRIIKPRAIKAQQ